MSPSSASNQHTLPSIHEILPEHFSLAARSHYNGVSQDRSSITRPSAVPHSSEIADGIQHHAAESAGYTTLPRNHSPLGSIRDRVGQISPHSRHCPDDSNLYPTSSASALQGDASRPKFLPHLFTTSPHAEFCSSDESSILFTKAQEESHLRAAHRSSGGTLVIAPQIRTISREDDKKHLCPYCPKRFNRPSSLETHINVHTGARPFECPKCGRTFSVNSNMRRHFRNHASDLPPFLQVHPNRPSPYPYPSLNTSPRPIEPGFYSYPSDSDYEEGSWSDDNGYMDVERTSEGSSANFRLGPGSAYEAKTT